MTSEPRIVRAFGLAAFTLGAVFGHVLRVPAPVFYGAVVVVTAVLWAGLGRWLRRD